VQDLKIPIFTVQDLEIPIFTVQDLKIPIFTVQDLSKLSILYQVLSPCLQRQFLSIVKLHDAVSPNIFSLSLEG